MKKGSLLTNKETASVIQPKFLLNCKTVSRAMVAQKLPLHPKASAAATTVSLKKGMFVPFPPGKLWHLLRVSIGYFARRAALCRHAQSKAGLPGKESPWNLPGKGFNSGVHVMWFVAKYILCYRRVGKRNRWLIGHAIFCCSLWGISY